MTGRLIWVSLPRATFGIIVRDGRVVDGAPYARGRWLRLVLGTSSRFRVSDALPPHQR